MSKKGVYPHKGVSQRKFGDWADLIKSNFEDRFYISRDSHYDNDYSDQKYVNRRGIYKDTYLSSSVYTDYQLRPNVCIAMAVAPEIFENDHAVECLRQIE